MKLLFVIPTLDRSGAEKQMTLLATHLPSHEFDIRVVVLTRTGPFEEDLNSFDIPVTLLHKKGKLDPIALLKLRKVIQEWKPDIVHSWLFAANSYVRLITGKKPAPKVIVSERCVDTWKQGWQLKLDQWQISRTTKLVGNSQAVAEFYRNLGYPKELVEVIPNAIVPYEGKHLDRLALRKELQLPEESKLIGYVGRLAHQKRVDDLLWAFKVLRSLRKDVHFLIVGDGPLSENLKRSAIQYECAEQVHFLSHQENGAAFMPLLDLFWLASEYEGMSNSLMEAMLAGVPVIASNISANRELILNGETGILVEVGDAVGFAQFSDRILADDHYAAQLGNAAQIRMESDFHLDLMIERYANLYRNIANHAE